MTEEKLFSKGRVAVNAASSLFAHVLNLAVLLWLQQYLLRRVSPAEYSLYPVMISVMVLLYMLRLILTSSIARYTTEAYAREDETGVTKVATTTFLLAAAIGSVILAAGYFFCLNVDQVLTVQPDLVDDATVMAWILLLSFAFQFTLTPFEVGLYATQKFVYLNVLRTLTNVLRIIFLFVLLFGIDTRVLWVVVASEAASVLGCLLTVRASVRALPCLRVARGAFDKTVARRLLSFGSWTFVSQLAYRIITSADPIILNKFGTPLDVTCYHLASLARKHLHNTIQVATQPLLPALTAMHARNKRAMLGSTYLRYGRYYLWAFLFVALPAIVFSSELIRLYVGGRFAPAAIILVLMLTESIPFLGNFMLYSLAVATEKIRDLARPIILLQFVNLALTLYLVGVCRMGALGAALATFIITGVSGVLVEVPLGLRLAGVKFREWLLKTALPGYLPAVASLVPLLSAKLFLKPDSWLELGAAGAAASTVYLAVVVLFALQEEDRRDLRRVLLRIGAAAGRRRARPAERPPVPEEVGPEGR